MKFIALFCPAIVSVFIANANNKKTDGNWINGILSYFIYVLLDNWVSICLIVYGGGITDSIVDYLNHFTFFSKYVAVELVIAIIIPEVVKVLKRYVHIRFTNSDTDEEAKDNSQGLQ